MKRRMGFVLAALVACWGIGENTARAQSWQLGTYGAPQVRQHQPVSPYLNMLGRGSLATDYYGIVRPQMDANRSITDLQLGLSNISAYGNIPSSALPPNTVNTIGGLQTGHPVSYFNEQRFFPLNYGTSMGNLSTPSFAGTGGLGTPSIGTTGTSTTPTQVFFPGTMNSIRR